MFLIFFLKCRKKISGPPPRQARSPRRTRRRNFFLYWDRALIYLTSCGKSRKVACPCRNALTKGKENLLCDLSTIFRPSPSRQCSTGFRDRPSLGGEKTTNQSWSYSNSCRSISMWPSISSGGEVGSKRKRGRPDPSMRNFSKFHLLMKIQFCLLFMIFYLFSFFSS